MQANWWAKKKCENVITNPHLRRYSSKDAMNSSCDRDISGFSSISRLRRIASSTQSSSSSTNGEGRDAISFSASFARLESGNLSACSTVSASVTIGISFFLRCLNYNTLGHAEFTPRLRMGALCYRPLRGLILTNSPCVAQIIQRSLDGTHLFDLL